ncbi:hypothetical protein IH992_19425 [Candidatus Poribacteria bacterium]|nr:hypothetical protein [Candidatus Poribacteria bacterium]
MAGNTGNVESNAGPSHRHFETTRWSIVLAAGHGSSPRSSEAMASLCETYWYPLYAYVRRRVRNADEAQDLTQEFFVGLLDKDTLLIGPNPYIAVAIFQHGINKT